MRAAFPSLGHAHLPSLAYLGICMNNEMIHLPFLEHMTLNITTKYSYPHSKRWGLHFHHLATPICPLWHIWVYAWTMKWYIYPFYILGLHSQPWNTSFWAVNDKGSIFIIWPRPFALLGRFGYMIEKLNDTFTLFTSWGFIHNLETLLFEL